MVELSNEQIARNFKYFPSVENFINCCLESYAVSNEKEYINILLDEDALLEAYDKEWEKADKLGDQTTDTNVASADTAAELKMLRAMLRTAINRPKSYIREKIHWLNNWMEEHFSEEHMRKMKPSEVAKWEKVRRKAQYVIIQLKEKLHEKKSRYSFRESDAYYDSMEVYQTLNEFGFGWFKDPEKITSEKDGVKQVENTEKVANQLKTMVDKDKSKAKNDKTFVQSMIEKWRRINGNIINFIQRWETRAENFSKNPTTFIGWFSFIASKVIAILLKISRYITICIDEMAGVLQRLMGYQVTDPDEEIDYSQLDDIDFSECYNFLFDCDEILDEEVYFDFRRGNIGNITDKNINNLRSEFNKMHKSNSDHDFDIEKGVYSYEGSYKNNLSPSIIINNKDKDDIGFLTDTDDYNTDVYNDFEMHSYHKADHPVHPSDLKTKAEKELAKTYENLKKEAERNNRPKSFFAKLVYKLRKLYTNILVRLDRVGKQKFGEVKGIFSKIKVFLARLASNVLHLIDRCMNKLQKMVDHD